MERTLRFNDGIIEGEVVRELQEIFPELVDSFRQRKSYDEYYYDETNIRIDLHNIEELNNLLYEIEIKPNECKILW